MNELQKDTARFVAVAIGDIILTPLISTTTCFIVLGHLAKKKKKQK